MSNYRLLILGLIIAVIFIFTGCGHQPDETLIEAESIMDAHPDSALKILEEYELPKTSSEYNRNLYNLLLAHAHYKNFITESSDSLLKQATEYFTEVGKTEEASKAHFLLGMIYLDANRLGEAAVSFSQGLDMARTDQYYMWEGQNARGLFFLYEKILDSSAQLKYSNEAYDAFSKGGYKEWMDWSKLETANAYNNNRQYEKANRIADELAKSSKESGDSLLLEEAMQLLGLTWFNIGNYNKSVEAYAAAYELNPQSITQNDLKNLSIAKFLTEKDSLSESTNHIMETISATSHNQPSYIVLANKGDYKEAYNQLILYRNYQDSVFNTIVTSNVSESIGKYADRIKQEKEIKRRNEHIMEFMLIILGIMGILTIYSYFRMTLHKKEARISELIVNIDALRNDLQNQIERSQKTDATIESISKPYLQLLKEKYAEANRLCDRYYQYADISIKPVISYEEELQIIKDFTNNEYLKEIEEYVDYVSDNLYSSFKKEIFNINEEKQRLFLYYLLGFSSRSISVFMGEKTSSIYNKKSRLKAAINKSEASRKQEYLKALQ